MPTESEKNDSGKSIADRLGIKETDRITLNDLTNNDGSEDPGSELDAEFSNTTNKDNRNTLNHLERNVTEKKVAKSITSQQSSGIPPKGEELDAFTNNASKKRKSLE